MISHLIFDITEYFEEASQLHTINSIVRVTHWLITSVCYACCQCKTVFQKVMIETILHFPNAEYATEVMSPPIFKNPIKVPFILFESWSSVIYLINEKQYAMRLIFPSPMIKRPTAAIIKDELMTKTKDPTITKSRKIKNRILRLILLTTKMEIRRIITFENPMIPFNNPTK